MATIHDALPFSLSAPCAVQALSAILGESWQALEADLRARGHILPGDGVHHNVMEDEIRARGLIVETEFPVLPRQTFGSWLKHPRDPEIVYLVSVTRHAIVVQGDRACGLTFTRVEPIGPSSYDRRIVHVVTRITGEAL